MFPKKQVVEILIADTSLVSQWDRFYAELLPDCESDMIQLQNGVQNRTVNNYQLFTEILTKWTGRNGNRATIPSLVQILRRDTFNEAADNLEARFGVQGNPSTAVVVGLPSTGTGKKVDKKLVVPILISDAQVVTNWKRLYETMLPGQGGGIVQLRINFTNENITVYDLFTEIISRWISLVASNATYGELDRILREIGQSNIAEEIKDRCLTGR